MDKVSFSRSEISLISRFEWTTSARASCCKRKLLRLLCKKTPHSGIELISEFPKEWLIIIKILFCRVSYCFCLFGEFAKVFERQVRVAHLHSAACALSSLSRCFQLSTNLEKDLFGCFFWAGILEQFSPTSKGYYYHVFLSHSETLHCENKIHKEFGDSANEIEIFIRVD